MTEQDVKKAKKYVLKDYPAVDDEATDAIYNILTALDLQIPTAPELTKFTKQCPNCKRTLSSSSNSKPMYWHCPRCGQAIDWGGNHD